MIYFSLLQKWFFASSDDHYLILKNIMAGRGMFNMHKNNNFDLYNRHKNSKDFVHISKQYWISIDLLKSLDLLIHRTL